MAIVEDTLPRRRSGTIRRLLDLPDRLRKMQQRRQAVREFAGYFADDPSALVRYREEVRSSGLLDELAAKKEAFEHRVRGETRGWRYVFGSIRTDEAIDLYALLRKARPRVMVETGVCNGFSSSFILAALERNGDGHLYSIDLPEVAGERYESGSFWEGKLGAVIPRGERPGWIIPDRLRSRWRLTLGRSQEELPPLLNELGTIDVFMHDSEHSLECMSFEFGTAFPALRQGGLLVADDFNWNRAFEEFAARHERRIIRISRKTAFFVK